MSKEVKSQDYCCCGLFHKHSLAFVAGTFLSIAYAAALARRIYTTSSAPGNMDAIIIAAAAIGFLVHLMLVIGNRQHNKCLYIPAMIFNVIWCIDQTRAAFFHLNFVAGVLQNAEAYHKAAGIPHTFEKFISLVILDLFFTVGGVLVAFGFLAIVVCGYCYLRREQKAAKIVQVENPVYANGPLPEKAPITDYI
ncbi:unnamed protein product [Bursaphelenchus xylophilus]|uniref:(pine wood nematode) hypothetical protein n=1 Tax=Bursaphelenchus xylophilus TaxID=6326 RepID=A0A1I7S713_BURXY|nr:unnamed protein product [Bursaphelenchus xylophilus]CAG9079439.1 unnamed protein product [Bursaphelenchus xylophilus]